MVQLTEKEVQDLINFANELPTKYGMSLIQFLVQKIEESKVETASI